MPSLIIPPYYQPYVDLLEGKTALDGLKSDLLAWKFAQEISDELGKKAYAPGKWTLNELLAHIIDAERVFAYRAMCIARGETQELPGFDQDAYVAKSGANTREFSDLLQEFTLLREANICLFQAFPEDVLMHKGVANGVEITVEAIGRIIAGHAMHHRAIMHKKYI